MNWKLVSEELPPLDTPVWLYGPANCSSPYLGERSSDADGWLWASIYGSDLYWSNGKWHATDAEQDDLNPTHWMPLPDPPKDGE